MSDDAATPPRTYIGSWKLRRRTIFCTLLYCAGEVTYLTVWGTDTALHQQIAVSLCGLAGAVVAFYVGGAAFDDHSIRRMSQ